MKKFINAIKYVVFLAIGVVIFYYIYKEFDLQTLKAQINNINWWWIGASIAAGLASNITRSMRWQMLITSTGHTASLPRTFCSVMSMAVHITDCGVISLPDRCIHAELPESEIASKSIE